MVNQWNFRVSHTSSQCTFFFGLWPAPLSPSCTLHGGLVLFSFSRRRPDNGRWQASAGTCLKLPHLLLCKCNRRFCCRFKSHLGKEKVITTWTWAVGHRRPRNGKSWNWPYPDIADWKWLGWNLTRIKGRFFQQLPRSPIQCFWGLGREEGISPGVRSSAHVWPPAKRRLAGSRGSGGLCRKPIATWTMDVWVEGLCNLSFSRLFSHQHSIILVRKGKDCCSVLPVQKIKRHNRKQKGNDDCVIPQITSHLCQPAGEFGVSFLFWKPAGEFGVSFLFWKLKMTSIDWRKNICIM